MKQEIALDLLQTMANATYTTRELADASPYSPVTVIGYLKELERQGLVERQKTERVRPGRPALVNLPTPSGLEVLRRGELGIFRKLVEEAGALWGPRRTFAERGIPFFGRPDVFAKRHVRAAPLDLIVERGGWIYEDPVIKQEGRYPSLEPFLAWVAKSENPRYLAACTALLRKGDVDGKRLAGVARVAGTTNRLGYLATVAGARGALRHLRPSDLRERMLPRPAPVDKQSGRIARQWNVENPLAASAAMEMMDLYGSE